MTPESVMRRWQGGQCDVFANVLLESLGPAIDADIPLAHTNFLCNIADHVLHLIEQHSMMNSVTKTRTIQECLVEHNNNLQVLYDL